MTSGRPVECPACEHLFRSHLPDRCPECNTTVGASDMVAPSRLRGGGDDAE